MAERTSYEPGTPCWVDLGVPDVAAAVEFYGALFGWTVEMMDDPKAGGYGQFHLRGEPVAGIGPQQNTELPPYWTVYVSVADADKTLEVMRDAGGTIVLEALDVMGEGRMGVVRDTNGSFISVWQPKAHIGSRLVNESGTFGWTELATLDLGATREFYAAAFGWGVDQEAGTDQSDIFTVDGRVVCGAHVANEGEHPSWSVWFGADDCDAAVARAVELGGSVVMAPNDMDFGRGAMIADPWGAVLGIAAPRPEVLADAG